MLEEVKREVMSVLIDLRLVDARRLGSALAKWMVGAHIYLFIALGFGASLHIHPRDSERV